MPVGRQPSPSTTSPAAQTGQITVLVGPSGCGKTTTLRMVNRMIAPTSGTITLDRRDTAALNAAGLPPRHRLRHQHAGLFRTAPSSTTSPPCRGCSAGTLGARRKRAMEMLDRVGLDSSYARRYPAQLSGGQRQTRRCGPGVGSRPAGAAHGRAFSAGRPRGAEGATAAGRPAAASR
ncbi:MAG: ATP-binding cassette domain-containing protein [Actinomycetales bacterium]|nr:ATP-binding cassette domain-containing protein [Actinomycetales bacterium]